MSAPYYILRRGKQREGSEVDNIIIGKRHFLMTQKHSYGHSTNNMARYMKIIPVEKQDDGSINTLGVNEQPEEITCLSLFFALYDQGYDTKHQATTHTLPYDAKNLTLGSLKYDGSRFLYYETNATGSSPFKKYPMNIGGLLNICNSAVDQKFLQGQEALIKAQIEDNLEKYLISQLIYMFVNRFYHPDAGIRVYFSGRSFGYFTRQNKIDLRVTFNFRSVLFHLNHQDNIDLLNHWENNVVPAFKNHKAAFQALNGDISIEDDICENPEMLETGMPYKPKIKKIIITIKKEASRDEKGVLLYYCYALAATAASSEKYYKAMNKYFEFFLYTAEGALNEKYTHRYTIGDGADFIQSFGADYRNNFLGQYLRYLSLSQASYDYKPQGGFEARARPKVIHIRDAHHATGTVYETAVIEGWKKSGKRYFWAVGPRYTALWHRVNSDYYRPDNIRIKNAAGDYQFQSIGRARNIDYDPIDSTFSVWAGLCSFKQLKDTDQCVFGETKEVFDKTLGRPMTFDPSADNADNDVFFGIRAYDYDNTSATSASFFSYGIDERAIVNCFYNVEDNQDKASAWRKNPSLPPGPDGKYPDFQCKILKESWFYTHELGLREIWRGRRLKYYLWDPKNISGYDRILEDGANGTTDTILNALGYEMYHIMYTYIKTFGDMPRNYRDIILFIETLRNASYGNGNEAKFVVPIYNEQSLLYRRYNLEMQCGELIQMNRLWNKADNTTLEYLEDFGSTMNANMNLVDPNRNCRFVNMISNLRTFYKQANLSDFDEDIQKTYCKSTRADGKTLACFGDLNDYYNFHDAPSANRNVDKCATQPKDLSTSANEMILYSRRGKELDTKVESFLPKIEMKGGAGKNLQQASSQTTTQTTTMPSSPNQQSQKVIVTEGSVTRFANRSGVQPKENWTMTKGKSLNKNERTQYATFIECFKDLRLRGGAAQLPGRNKVLLYAITKKMHEDPTIVDTILQVLTELYPIPPTSSLEENMYEDFGPTPMGRLLMMDINSYFAKLTTYALAISPSMPEAFAAEHFKIGPIFKITIDDLIQLQINQISLLEPPPPEPQFNTISRNNNTRNKNKNNKNKNKKNNKKNNINATRKNNSLP